MREVQLLKLLQDIFDEVWQEFEPKTEDQNADERRSELARLIILAHRKGLNPEEIKTAILTDLLRIEDTPLEPRKPRLKR
jgi:hypothetical protein